MYSQEDELHVEAFWRKGPNTYVVCVLRVLVLKHTLLDNIFGDQLPQALECNAAIMQESSAI